MMRLSYYHMSVTPLWSPAMKAATKQQYAQAVAAVPSGGQFAATARASIPACKRL